MHFAYSVFNTYPPPMVLSSLDIFDWAISLVYLLIIQIETGLLYASFDLGWLNQYSYGPNSQANIKGDCNIKRKISFMLNLMYTPPPRGSLLSRKSVSPFVHTHKGVEVEHFEQRLWPVTQEQRYLLDDTDL
jgi:hypothetical protein